jgi:hypothetical protein
VKPGDMALAVVVPLVMAGLVGIWLVQKKIAGPRQLILGKVTQVISSQEAVIELRSHIGLSSDGTWVFYSVDEVPGSGVCEFTNQPVLGDYVIPSSTENGKCHDSGIKDTRR